VIPQRAGFAVLYWAMIKRSGGRAALAPFAAAGIYFVWSTAWWYLEAVEVEKARGEPACGAFGALVAFATFGGAFLQFMVAGLVAIVWYILLIRNRPKIFALG
jgi:hypothetical protein